MDERGHLLPDDSCQRLARVWSVLQSAAAQRARLTPAQLVERAWRSLGGDAWLTQSELMNTNRFFQLLNELQVELEENQSVNLLDPTLLESRLQELYAEPNPTPEGTPFVELLTIHKAKGLEWDVVLVPALERQPAADRSRLLTWSELEPTDSSADASAHFMLAPIAGRGEPSKALNNWLNGIHRAREAAERKRLFYVACTRARQELHLFASPSLSTNGEIHPHSTSLLQAAWPAAEAHFSPSENLGAPDGVPGERSLLAGVARLDPETWVRATNLRVFNPTDELDLAASASPTLERLPLDFDPAVRFAEARAHRLPYGDPDDATASSQAQFSRPEGSFAARSFGNVVHAALETLADRIATGSSPAALLAELPTWLRASPRCCAPTDLPTPPSTASPARPAQPWKTLCATLTASGCLPPTPRPPANSPSPPGPSLITRTVNPPFAPLPSALSLFVRPHLPRRGRTPLPRRRHPLDRRLQGHRAAQLLQSRRLPRRPARRLRAPV